MEVQQARYFLALSETLNFTRAAVACGVTQPSLTKAVKRLEEELGGPLLTRERGLTHLTDLGRRLRPHIEAMVRADDLTRLEAARRTDLFPVRLGVMCTIGPTRLIPFLRRMRTDVPSLEIKLHDAPGRDLVRLALEGEIDAALLALPDLPVRLDRRPLYRENYVVAFPPGHRFERMDRVPLRELNHENYLNRANCEYPEHFDALGIPDPAADVHVVHSGEREDWIQAMILAGLGCAVMPEFLPVLPGIPTRVLVEPEIRREVNLITVAGRRFPPALDRFLDLARRHDWGGTMG